jgi:hypothetical protein
MMAPVEALAEAQARVAAWASGGAGADDDVQARLSFCATCGLDCVAFFRVCLLPLPVLPGARRGPCAWSDDDRYQYVSSATESRM